MKNLKTIEAKVKAILQKNEDARNDDMTLYLIVCNTYLKGAGAMPFAEVMEQYWTIVNNLDTKRRKEKRLK